MKRKIKLSESDLRRIVNESMNRLINEHRRLNEGIGISNDTIEKLSTVLTWHYSMYQADMIERAIFDDTISLSDFKDSFNELVRGIRDDDDDEYSPGVFGR